MPHGFWLRVKWDSLDKLMGVMKTINDDGDGPVLVFGPDLSLAMIKVVMLQEFHEFLLVHYPFTVYSFVVICLM